MTPLVSCIVPLFNQLALTRRMLLSLRESLPPGLSVEIILVDDASTDGTREWCAGPEADGCRVLLNTSNRGYAHSNNRGAGEARGTYLALLNNDLVLDRGWLEPMLSAAEELGERAGIVGNLQYRVETRELDHAGIDVNRQGKLQHLQEPPPPAAELHRRGLPVFAVTGACCLIRRERFLAMKGFDERFENGGEDVDLCLRLRAAGHGAYLCRDSSVWHHVSASRGPSSLKDERNSRLLYERHHEVLLSRVAEAWLDPRQGPPSRDTRVAGMLARSALWREEARWATLLDNPPAPPPPRALTATGFRRSTAASQPWIEHAARIVLPPGLPTRNLFLAGHLASAAAERPESAGPLGLRVLINSAQERRFDPLPEGDFNLAIEHPASLPGVPTEVCIELLHTPPRIPGWLRHLADLIPGAYGRKLGSWARRHKQRRFFLARLVADDQTALDTEQSVLPERETPRELPG